MKHNSSITITRSNAPKGEWTSVTLEKLEPTANNPEGAFRISNTVEN